VAKGRRVFLAKLGWALLAVMLLAPACMPARQAPVEPMTVQGVEMPTAAPAVDKQAAESSAPARAPAPVAATGERMLIKRAEIVARVAQVDQAVAQIQDIVRELGGYAVTINSWTQDDSVGAYMTVRVPAERFDEVMTRIAGVAERVERTTVTGEDVTEEYFDLEARLRALRATAEQLLELLADVRERMQSAEEIIAVYKHLQGVQEQIEQLEGRRRYLERMAAMCSIEITLRPSQVAVTVMQEGWQPLQTARRALRALVAAAKVLADGVIWLALFVLPVLLVFALPFVVLITLFRLARRRSARSRAAGNG